MGPILCGTDFSPLAESASGLAQGLAGRLGVPFYRVHVHDSTSPVPTHEDQPGLECLQGYPDEALVERAQQMGASLLVVGSLGRRSLGDWLLGSTAERVVRCSTVPTLVVRQPERLAAWANGQRPLRVMLAVCQDGSVEPALKWLERFSQVGSVSPFAVQVSGGPHLNDAWFEAETERLHLYTGFPRAECQIEVAQWAVEEHLITAAERNQADLILMGTHLRSGLERLWRGSVSMAVLRRATISVACAPG